MDKADGKIITFYSYKGGTGRSMMLANVAWILASKGKKVLVIDWDLEAPGLHRYFAPFLLDTELQSTTGLIDFLFEYVEASLTNPKEQKDKNWYLPYTDLSRYTTSLININFLSNGTLDFICAGKQDSDYAFKVNTFDWMVFYQNLQGGTFLEIVKKQIKKEYDYVLIDSRTGVSDTSGICTIQMPDTIVACFTYNFQSIDGVTAVLDSVVTQRQKNNVTIFPIPTRVDNYEKDHLDRAKEYARAKLDKFLRVITNRDYWGSVHITYQPYYAYEEILSIFRDKVGERDSMLAEMEIITEIITNGDVTGLIPPTDSDKKNILDAYSQKFERKILSSHTQLTNLETEKNQKSSRHTKNHVFISYSAIDGLETATKLARKLENEFPTISTWIDKRELRPGNDWEDDILEAMRTSKCLLFLMTEDSTAAGSPCKAEWTWGLRNRKPIIPLQISQKAEMPFRLGNRQPIDFVSSFDSGLAKLRQQIAYIDSPEGQLYELRQYLEDLQRDLRSARSEDKPRIQSDIEELKKQIKSQEIVVQNSQKKRKKIFGNDDTINYTKAIEYFSQGVQGARDTGNRYLESKRLNELGIILIDMGNFQEAIKHLQESIQIGSEINNPELCNISSSSLAEIYLIQSELFDARATIETALQYDFPENNHNASALHGIIALRQGDEVTARGAFVRAIGQADEILSKTAEYYSALDAKGLAICGLTLCRDDLHGHPTGIGATGIGATGIGASPIPTDAIETFKKARKIAPHAGVVKSVLRLFDELAKCDPEGILKDVRSAVEGKR